jgi:hypothetical protein
MADQEIPIPPSDLPHAAESLEPKEVGVPFAKAHSIPVKNTDVFLQWFFVEKVDQFFEKAMSINSIVGLAGPKTTKSLLDNKILFASYEIQLKVLVKKAEPPAPEPNFVDIFFLSFIGPF